MSDPARVYARKYADLEAERDRYRAALEQIRDTPRDCGVPAEMCADEARAALEGPNDAPREEGS